MRRYIYTIYFKNYYLESDIHIEQSVDWNSRIMFDSLKEAREYIENFREEWVIKPIKETCPRVDFKIIRISTKTNKQKQIGDIITMLNWAHEERIS